MLTIKKSTRKVKSPQTDSVEKLLREEGMETEHMAKRRLFKAEPVNQDLLETKSVASSQEHSIMSKTYIKPKPKSPTRPITPGILQRQEERERKK